MESLTARIASFKPPARRTKSSKPTWQISPSTHPKITPENLAEAGFFFNPSVEEPDNCQCFSCGLQLGGWDEDDDPFVEQCKRFDCAWGEMVCAPRIARDRDEIIMTVSDESLLPSSSASTQTRIKTFHSQSGETFWPHKPKKSWKPSIENVAAAGFVYQESPDYAMCPYCQYTIGDWEAGDDPMSIHQTRKPNCPFFTITLETAPVPKASTKSAPKPRATRGKRTTTAVPPSVAESVVEDDEEVLDFEIEPVKKGRKARATVAKSVSTAKGRGKKVAESEVAESVMEEDEPEAETQSVVAAEVEKPKRRGRPAKKAESAPEPEVPAVLEDVQEVPEPPKKERKPRATKASKKADAEAQAEAEAEMEMVVEPEVEAEVTPVVQEPTPLSKPSKSSKSRASKATKAPVAVIAPPIPEVAPMSKPAHSVPPSPAVPSKPSRPIKSIRAAKLEKSLAASASASASASAPTSSSTSFRPLPPSKPTSGKSSKPTSASQSNSKPLPPTPKETSAPRSQPLNHLAQYANIPPTSPLVDDRETSRERLDAALDQAAKSARQVIVDFASSRPGDVNMQDQARDEEEGWMKELLTEEERKMTVEQLIKRQLERRAKAMEEEGEEMIRKWKDEAMVVRGQIKAALRP